MPSSSSPPPAEPTGPRVLVVDTASRTEALALAQGNWVVSVLACRTRRGHSGLLLPQIDQLLEQQGWRPADLDGFGVVVGPGSFTGIRVGIATVAGLARAMERPAFGYGSLEIRAMALRGLPGLQAPVLDARKGEVYAAAYRDDEIRIPAAATPPGEFAEALARAAGGETVWVSGGGARLYADLLEKALGQRLRIAGGRGDMPGVAEMAVHLAGRIAAGEQPADDALAPVYLRASQAELGIRPS